MKGTTNIIARYVRGEWEDPQPSVLSFFEGETDEFDEGWPRAGTCREVVAHGRRSKVHDEWHTWSSTSEGEQSARLWPTPCATDYKGATRIGQRRRQLPEALLKYPLWPTPTTQDAKNDGSVSQQARNSKPLNALVVSHPEGAERDETDHRPRLNPVFVELLMGFPQQWTDLDE